MQNDRKPLSVSIYAEEYGCSKIGMFVLMNERPLLANCRTALNAGYGPDPVIATGEPANVSFHGFGTAEA